MNNATETIRSTGAQDSRIVWFLLLPAVALVVALLIAIYDIVAVLGLMAMVVGVLLIRRPDFAVYLFVFGIYINAPVIAVRFHGVPQIVATAFAGVLAIPLVHHLFVKKRQILLDPIVPWIFVFIVVQMIGVLVADHRQVATRVLITSITEGLILFGLVTNVIRSHEVLRRAVLALVLAGAFMGSLSVYQKVTNSFDREFGGFAQVPTTDRNGVEVVSPNPRSVGPIGEKNYYGQFMLLLVPLCLATISWTESRPRQLVLVVATLLCLSAVALTASRGAAIGFCVLLVAMYAMRELTKRQAVWLVSAAVVLVLMMPGIRERMAELFDAASVLRESGDLRATDSSIQGRATEMMAAALVFRDSPIIGVGSGNFQLHFPTKANALGFQIHGETRMAHCSYLEIAAENGILGIVCFLAIFYVTTRNLWQARQVATHLELKKTATAFFLVMIAMIVTSTFLSFAYIRYYWLILALCSVAARLALDSARPPHPAETATS